ncbi:hypothetical protein [Pedobacter sp. L105]|uniref:TRAFAC clade GTPase domain-containing protein n=1 Tax=Pedobacter sp. L105 TaxID=1641871 RepID=UPI00131D35E9|nr:hypothetical protein [Pedobacter sp. L105]
MSSEQLNSCMFIGLPNSGKSSFIGALWHVVESGEIDSLYSITVQPDDREYLNSLRSSFLDCKSVERTKTESVKKIELEIKDNTNGQVMNFVFPDLSGETYESQFEYRKLTIDYIDQVSGCNSIMLFVNPDFIKKGHLILNVDEMLDFKDSSNNLEINDKGNIPGKQMKEDAEVKWTPKLCQSQVVLVDLLQIISKNIKLPCKINIIVSAWDVIVNLPDFGVPKLTPSEWFIEELPMLFQYLISNAEAFPHKVFGVSAQGGIYSEEDDENLELQGKLKQSERIIVQSEKSVTHDITVPLKWLFE